MEAEEAGFEIEINSERAPRAPVTSIKGENTMGNKRKQIIRRFFIQITIFAVSQIESENPILGFFCHLKNSFHRI